MDARSRFMGGGTLLMRDINYGHVTFDRLVRTSDPEFTRISSTSSGVTLGAGVTMSAILRDRTLSQLHTVARSVGGPAIRNMASVGGNLFAPPPYGDLAAALLALDAQVTLGSGAMTSLESLLDGRGSFREIVTAVQIPSLSRHVLKYRKVSRVKPKGVSVMSIAVRITGYGSSVQDARVVFSGMGPHALRSRAAENALRGKLLDERVADAAAAACLEGLEPGDDELASAWYRSVTAPVHLRRLLLDRST